MAFKSGRAPLQHERQVFFLALLTGLPILALALALLWVGDFSRESRLWLTIVALGLWLAIAARLRERVVRPLQTISNMLAAFRAGDFSMRAHGSNPADALGLLLLELNGLGDELRAQRLGALEATALLQRVMEEIEVAVFAFDSGQELRLVNRAGAALLGRRREQLLGRSAEELGLAECLNCDLSGSGLELAGATGRWDVRRGTFRQDGLPHDLLVLTDVSRALSREERQAWQRLMRVLSHELNNSLAPIKSLTQSLSELVQHDPPCPDWRQDIQNGLAIIGSRADSLSRLMTAYARLARLPNPRRESVSVVEWVRRVVALETRRAVSVCAGPDVTIRADGAQLDQLLINVVRNAVDATLDSGGDVEVGWTIRDDRLEVWVRDGGPGFAETDNLFVPFFTTKSNGSGIGLVLSRQIAEAHGGRLTLTNRSDATGCEARLALPILRE